MYNAICCSNEQNSQAGFASYKDAEQHIRLYLCSSCLEELEAGGIMSDGVWYKTDSALGTACGAEWIIDRE